MPIHAAHDLANAPGDVALDLPASLEEVQHASEDAQAVSHPVRRDPRLDLLTRKRQQVFLAQVANVSAAELGARWFSTRPRLNGS
jgi:hypothetical protein